MFKKLFRSIFTSHNSDIQDIYNAGVLQLSANNIPEAIELFERVCEQHESAAYNLGLIYLHGVGKMTPKYDLARKYFQIAHRLGHPKASKSAQIIGLDGEVKLTVQQQLELFQLAVAQYATAGQFGNLAYLIAYDIKRNILATSTNALYSLDRFLSYELYCIRNYADKEVLNFYRTSDLTYLPINYLDDWKNGETAKISDYLVQVWGDIIKFSNEQLNFFEMGTLRVSIVNTVYAYF